jgi:hypothetical protein
MAKENQTFVKKSAVLTEDFRPSVTYEEAISVRAS